MKPRVSVFQNVRSLSVAAAERFASLSERAIRIHGRFSAALSGGSSPRTLYALLGSEPFSKAIDWEGVHFFWADERCVSMDHPESNYGAAYELFLSRIPVNPENIHRIKGELGPEEAARDYERELVRFFREKPRFSLAILGIGADGHTASLFPGSPVLDEKKHLAGPVVLAFPHLSRVTLTYPALNKAEHIIFIAVGKEKAEIAAHMATGAANEFYPAARVIPESGTLELLLDSEAAAGIRQ